MFATRNSHKHPRRLQTVKKVFKHTQTEKNPWGDQERNGWTMLKMI
jgi:hypothetical protein